MLFGSLLVKNYRILQVFQNKRLSTEVITDRTLVLYVSGLLLIDVSILVPFAIFSECGEIGDNNGIYLQ